MKISLNWLKNYINIDLSPKDIVDKLTMSGLEVESVEEIGKELEGFIIAKVLEVCKHPNANKLSVCKVFDGVNTHQIVCGAPNVAADQIVVLGLSGTYIPHSLHSENGEGFTLSKVKIRGVESNGMICSGFELGINSDADGILILPNDAPIGKSYVDYLDIKDIVFEIGITPNRPDALSHIGIARDLGAIFNSEYKYPELKIVESPSEAKNAVKIEIEDPENCPRYCGRVIKNIKVAPSPLWLQKCLRSIGLRPINNIVDITNFVLYEIGHPLHAFDYDLLNGNKIIVRKAQANEKFITLDEKEHKLTDDTLLICDGERGVAIAGVMGGLNSEIKESTKNVLLESAYFRPGSVRKTSKNLGISTDASYRFERGTDPNITEFAINRAAMLISEIAGGEVLKGVVDIYPKKIENLLVDLRIQRTNEILGTEITKEEIINILKRLGILLVNEENEKLIFSVPTYRPDIEREIDLIEEVARIYGYNNIKDRLESNIKFGVDPLKTNLEKEVRNYLVGSGFNEIITNSLLDKKDALVFEEKVVDVINPISQTMTTLRPSLIPGVLQTISRNINFGESNLRLFEFGNIFKKNDDASNYDERLSLIIAMTGNADFDTWNLKNRALDFYDIKGRVESLLAKIFLDSYKLFSYSNREYCLNLEVEGKTIGILKQLEEGILRQFDIEQNVFICEIDFDSLEKAKKRPKKYIAPIKYPSVRRDIAFIIDVNVKIFDLEQEVRKSASTLLKKIDLFDIFSGGKLESNKKNIAFALEFVSEDHSLNSEEVDKDIEKIVNSLKEKYSAVLRQF